MSAQRIPAPHSSPPSLTSLPAEIISLIIRYLDISSVLSLARVFTAFNELCQPRIWEQLNLSRRARLGPWGRAAKAVSGVRGDAEKVNSLLRIGSEERWRRVRGIVAFADPDSLDGIIGILSHTAPNLESLRIRGSRDSRIPYIPTQWLEVRLHLSGIPSFPSLTHLVLDDQAIRYIETLVVLCDLAPNLRHLQTSASDHYHPRRKSADSDTGATSSDRPGTLSCVFPHRVTRDTLIRHLHIQFEPEDYDVDRAVGSDSYEIIVDIITRSPPVEELSIIYILLEAEHETSTLAAVRTLPALRELAWPSQSMVWHGVNGSGTFARLQRLVLAYTDWNGLLPTSDSAVLPSLDTLCFSYESNVYKGAPIIPQFESVKEAIPAFAAWFRYHPLLRHLHFFERDKGAHIFSSLDPANYTGKVQSLWHGHEEIIVVSLLFRLYRCTLPHTSPSPAPSSEVPFLHIVSDDREMVPWEAVSGLIEEDTGREPEWLEFADLDGVEVPQEVLREVLEAGGISEATRDKRGLEVGAEAWRVVSDWRKKLGS